MSHPPDPELLAITDEGGCDLNCDAVMRLTLDVDDAFLAATIAGSSLPPHPLERGGFPVLDVRPDVKGAHPRPRQRIS